MKPATLSASSIANWVACQQMFVATNVNRVPEVGEKNAANVGTAVHYALEHFVRLVYMLKTEQWDNLKLLLELYLKGFEETFGHADKKSAEFKDGLALVKKWHARTDLTGWTIDNVEEKKRTPIADTGILLTYIFDRVQWKVDENNRLIVKVVDYKTIRRTYSHDQLREMLQARIYALAVAIEFKAAGRKPDEIWVELDLLRYDPVGVEIDYEENIETWEYLLSVAGIILATDAADATYTLGAGCKYCPVANSCPELEKHIAAGGFLGLSIDETVDRYAQISGQIAGLTGLQDQLQSVILKHGADNELAKLSTEKVDVAMSLGAKRGLTDTSRAARIIGDDLMAMFGKLNIGDVDKLLDSDQINEDQKRDLRKLIERVPNRATTIKVTPRSPLAKDA